MVVARLVSGTVVSTVASALGCWTAFPVTPWVGTSIEETRVSGVTVALDWAANCTWDSFPRFAGIRLNRVNLAINFLLYHHRGGTFRRFLGTLFTTFTAYSIFAFGISVCNFDRSDLHESWPRARGADEADPEPNVVPALRCQKFLDFKYWTMNSRSVLYVDTLAEFMAICGASASGTTSDKIASKFQI